MKYYSPYVVKKVRNVFIALLILHLLLLVEKLVFDILGYVYLLIVVNAVSLCFVVLTICASCSFKAKPLIVFVIWLIPWIVFNGFVIIVYLGLVHVSDDYYWLNLKVSKNTWFYENAFGCTLNSTLPVGGDGRLTNCFVSYEYVEVVQASIQIIISVVNAVISCWLIVKFKIEEEEEYFGFFGGFDSFSARVSPTESSLPKIKYMNDEIY